ncbi:UNVERIFIED_CONTAM: Band 7 protein [Trichonephila clavipes]
MQPPENKFTEASQGICGRILTVLSVILALITFPISIFLCLIVVPEYERIVVFRLGRLVGGKARGPGLCFLLPCVDSFHRVDMRSVTFNIPAQEILIQESITVQVDAVIYYRIVSPTESVVNVSDATYSTQLLAQTTLRGALGDRQLEEIVADRQAIAESVKGTMNETTDQWGIKVEKLQLKDIRLPEQIQRAMAIEAEAIREAKAKVICADGEKRASVPLKEAAEKIASNPVCLQLRYLQTLNSITTDKTSTIVLPLPIDFYKPFSKVFNR